MQTTVAKVEHLVAEYLSAALDLYRDLRDAGSEAAFYEVYGNMWSLQMADQRADIRRQTRFDPRAVPAVRQVLDELDHGGLPEAVIRAGMLDRKSRQRGSQIGANGAYARVACANRHSQRSYRR
jgi:hypothetical protein